MAGAFPLYSSYTALGWRKIKYIDFARGEAAVAAGALEHVYDALGAFHGYQLVDDSGDVSFPSADTAGALRAAEAAAIAGLMGPSATKNLQEYQRLARVRELGLPAEDFIELSEVKVRMQTGSSNHDGDKATRVYPKAPEVKKAREESNVSNGSQPDRKAL